MYTSYEFNRNLVNFFSNSISLIFILFCFFLFTIISYYNKEINHSITYRLSLCILLSDLIYNLRLISEKVLYEYGSPSACYLNFWVISFGISSSMLYSIAIAVIYLLNIKYQYKITKLIQRLILITPTLISLTISLSPIVFNKIDATEKSCKYKTKEGEGYWSVVCNFSTVFVGIAVIPITYTILICHLIKKKRELNRINSKLNRSGLDISYYTLSRLVLYPLIPIVAHSATIYISIGALLETSIDAYSANILILFLTFFSGIQGFINSILYLTNSIFLKEINVLIDKLFGSEYYKSL